MLGLWLRCFVISGQQKLNFGRLQLKSDHGDVILLLLNEMAAIASSTGTVRWFGSAQRPFGSSLVLEQSSRAFAPEVLPKVAAARQPRRRGS